MTLTVLRNISHAFCQILITWNLSGGFLLVRLGQRVWEGDHRGEVTFSALHIEDICLHVSYRC